MASDGDDENATVEGHQSKHHHVSNSNPNPMHHGLNDPGGDISRTRLHHHPPLGQPLDSHRQQEDQDQSHSVHAGPVRSGPTGEENFGVFAPEESHVHGHGHAGVHIVGRVVHVVAGAAGCRSHRRRRGAHVHAVVGGKNIRGGEIGTHRQTDKTQN